MPRGGKKPGSGRPKGSTSKPKITDYLSEEKMNKLVQKAYKLAEAGDSKLIIFILEQKFGKAPQALTGADGNDLVVHVINYATE